ncbi:MAG: DUF362 domain-containing protein [Proteobacteria bacterium]|nr:DUF362 domain-containing protein [Pseudomonadota bacterium]
MSQAPPRVYVARVDGYDHDALAAAIGRGLDHVGARLKGNVVAKANWVFAHRGLSPAACTRPEVAHAAFEQLLRRDPDLYVLMCGNSGLGVSTRRMCHAARGEHPRFRCKGFAALPDLHRGRVQIRPTDETRYYRYQLSVGRPMTDEERADPNAEVPPEARYWERVVTGWELQHADSVLFLPKLKTNVLSHGMSAATKLQGIGFLRDADRPTGHDWNNGRRIADMLEVTDPDLIITDAVDIGRGSNQMTQVAHRLGVVIVADNAVAHDAVCARILGLDPADIPHLRLASERGFGPLSLTEIALETEEPLERFATRVRGFGVSGLMRVDAFGEHFERTTGAPFPLQIVAGEPYDVPGSCGILLDWLYTAFDDPARRNPMKAWPSASVFVGDVDAEPEHDVLYLVGDRAIASHGARCQRLRTLFRMPPWLHRRIRGVGAIARDLTPEGNQLLVIELPGDPPSHRDLILGFFFGSRGRLRATFLRLDLIIESYLFGTLTTLRRMLRNRGGISVVHARKIARLADRPWRVRWGQPERLKPRAVPPPLPSPPTTEGA